MPNRIPQTITKLFFILMLLLLPLVYRSCTSVNNNIAHISAISPSERSYFLKSDEDRLIVTSSDGKVTEILNIDPRTLPPYDQKALLNGIQIENGVMLEEILQDFS